MHKLFHMCYHMQNRNLSVGKYCKLMHHLLYILQLIASVIVRVGGICVSAFYCATEYKSRWYMCVYFLVCNVTSWCAI